jgi:hypothetical protein
VLLIFRDDDPPLAIAQLVPPGHRVLVHDTFECADRVARALAAKGLESRLVELPRPFRQRDVLAASDGYGPQGKVRWAMLTMPAATLQIGAEVCAASGLHFHPEARYFSAAPATAPSDRCPACGAQVREPIARCHGCGLAFVAASSRPQG